MILPRLIVDEDQFWRLYRSLSDRVYVDQGTEKPILMPDPSPSFSSIKGGLSDPFLNTSSTPSLTIALQRLELAKGDTKTCDDFGFGRNSQSLNMPDDFDKIKEQDEQAKKTGALKLKKGVPSRRKSGVKLQKSERNALTNLSNQLVTFLAAKKRCNYHIERLFPTISLEAKEIYFETMREQKKHLCNYISEGKLLNLWHPQEGSNNFQWVIVRALSHYYLREQLVPGLITSKRMPAHYKSMHLSVRRKMLRMLSRSSNS